MSGSRNVTTRELDYRAMKWGNLGKKHFSLPTVSCIGKTSSHLDHFPRLVSEDLSNMVREVMEKIYFCIENIYIYFTFLVNKRYVTTRCSELHRILQAT